MLVRRWGCRAAETVVLQDSAGEVAPTVLGHVMRTRVGSTVNLNMTYVRARGGAGIRAYGTYVRQAQRHEERWRLPLRHMEMGLLCHAYPAGLEEVVSLLIVKRWCLLDRR